MSIPALNLLIHAITNFRLPSHVAQVDNRDTCHELGYANEESRGRNFMDTGAAEAFSIRKRWDALKTSYMGRIVRVMPGNG